MSMKTLVFAEKPSVGRDIAGILNAKMRFKGYLEGEKHIVTWGFGHLVSIGSPELQDPNWKYWDLKQLPMLPTAWKLSVIPNAAEQFEVVKSLFNRKDVELVINAADAGREGELIFRLVYAHAGCEKPIKRLWISSMTDEAIKKGFEELHDGVKYDNLGKAALCRSRADWLVGMNLTRAYTKKHDTKYTLGRVQTPTLAMVVARHLEIKNFISKDYWEINGILSDFKAQWFDPKAKEQAARIDDLKTATETAERIKGKTALIDSVKKSSKKQAPPFLYDLTSLQRDANTKYGMTAADSLATLQGLYEKRKVVTYPRTDSRYLSEDIFPTINSRLASLPKDYEPYLVWLRGNLPTKTKRIFNNSKVSDHHAIIPTEKKVVSLDGWSRAEQNIYDLIVRRFLAVFYPDHKYMSTVILLKAGEDSFKATGKVVTDEGWKAVYSKTDEPVNVEKGEGEEEDGQSLPSLKKGDKREIMDSELLTKKTKPPQAYTEASLLQAMETAGKLVDDEELRDAMKDSGLGTPATRAEIIEKLIKVEYMERDKKRLVPTAKGIKLVELAEAEIKSPELTGNWEKRLSDIARAKDKDGDFMDAIESFVREMVGRIKGCGSGGSGGSGGGLVRSPIRRRPPVSHKVLSPCPACGLGGIIEGSRGYGCNRFREGCSYVIWKEFEGKLLPITAIKALMKGEETRLIKGFKLADGTEVAGRVCMKADKSGIELIIIKED
jgi:DNA topoisomerase-3